MNINAHDSGMGCSIIRCIISTVANELNFREAKKGEMESRFSVREDIIHLFSILSR